MLATLAVAALLLVPQDPAPARDTTPAKRRRPAPGDTLKPRDFEQFVARDSTRARRKGNEIRRAEVTDALRQSAFADAPARELLEKARVARLRNDASIKSYDATSYQRLSAGLGFKMFGKERLAFRVENSAHVQWARDVGVHLELTGSRVAMPVIAGIGGDEAQKEMQGGTMGDMAPIPWYPGKEALWVGGGIARAQVNEREIVHPLASGSEAYYRYATGDSLSLAISKDRTIRLRELRITARQPKWNLIVGSFWFDMSTGQLVRAVYRLSQPMDPIAVAKEVGDSSDKKDLDEIPLLAKALIYPMQVDLQAVTIEYGLFNGVWMPRTQSLDAFVRVSFMRLPVRMDERYTYASVNADDAPRLATILAAKRHSNVESGSFNDDEDDDADSTETTKVSVGIGKDGATANVEKGRAPRSRTARDSIRAAVRDSIKAREAPAANTDSARKARAERREAREKARAEERRKECEANNGFRINTEMRYGGTLPVAVRVPCDTTVLSRSRDLPPSIYDNGEELFGAAERDELVKSLDLGLQAGWGPQKLEWQTSIADGAFRYNRVEGFSSGLGVRQALGAGYGWHADARYNFGEATLLGEAGISRSNGRRTIDLTGYRRTSVASDWGSPFGFGASLAALLYGRDEAFYYRTAGAELVWRSDPKRDDEFRLFGEQQANMPVVTTTSLFGGSKDPGFVPNLTARAGTIYGATARVRRSVGVDPNGWRAWGDGRAEVGAGDWSYQRGAIDLGVSHPVAGPIEFAFAAGGGAAFGDVPQQRLFYLGGLHTIRGLAPGTMADRGGIAGTPGGTAYWLTRSELAWGRAGMRTIAFYDAGWTGRKHEWLSPGRPMQGAGLGMSVLDGLLRFDVARGIYPTQQWRVDFSVDARF
jgi:hypothetical protein